MSRECWSDDVRGMKSLLLVSVLVSVPLLGVTNCSPRLLFESPVNLAGITGGGAIATLAVDLDNDSIPEIVSAASGDSVQPHLRIYQWNGGNWSVIDLLPPSTVDDDRRGRFGGALAAADVDGDGWADLLVPNSPNASGPGEVYLFLNPGASGIYAPWVEIEIASWPDSSVSGQPTAVSHMAEIAAGDLDGDGDIDVVTRDINSGVFILENDGAGNFTRHFVATNPREGLALFDPDGDGDLDILINGVWLEAPHASGGGLPDLSDTDNYTVHHIKALAESSSPWYPAGASTNEIRDYAVKVLAADLDGDGLQDVVFTNSEELNNAASTASKPKGLWVYWALDQTGDNWFVQVVEPDGFDLHTLDAADLDGDGDLDLLTGISTVGKGTSDAEVFVFRNDGWRSWTRRTVSDDNIYSGILADYDGNGVPDIVGPENWNSGPVRGHRNVTPEGHQPLGPCPLPSGEEGACYELLAR